MPFSINPPAIDRWLDTQPKPFAIAEVPAPSPGNLGELERHQTRSMFHATAHWQKTIHGYSSLRRPLHDRLYVELTGFPDATSLASLRGVGVTYVVVHTEDYGERWPAVEEQIAKTRRAQARARRRQRTRVFIPAAVARLTASGACAATHRIP